MLVGPDRFKTMGIWDRQTGERLGSLYALQEGEWLVTTPSGLFDGSPRGWRKIAWRAPNGGLATLPSEAFFNEFYRPGLLAELLEGHKPSLTRTIAQVDRRQPIVSLSSKTPKVVLRAATVHLELMEGGTGAGLRDVRLFRNGILVKYWQGDFALQDGKATLDATIPLLAGENRLVAYAFNHDDVKSEDATLKIECIAPAQPGVAYIVSVGVNHYSNSQFDLRFATPDASYLAQTLAASETGLGAYRKVVQVQLLDQEATRANLLLAFSILAGKTDAAAHRDAPPQLSMLQAVQPEDSVAVYFAGHGLAWGDHFYMIPYDLGFDGKREDLRASLDKVLSRSVSDVDLEQAFNPIDASHILLMIDACNSGKLLDADDERRGPMNSKGLAQLAYEKGMYVLTAAQAYQTALESSRLGHGYLTFALAEEGLKTAAADTRPADGQLSAVEWFEYAARRVPQLQGEALNQPLAASRSLRFEISDSPGTPHVSRLQTPRLYYRRDQPGGDTIVAKVK